MVPADRLELVFQTESSALERRSHGIRGRSRSLLNGDSRRLGVEINIDVLNTGEAGKCRLHFRGASDASGHSGNVQLHDGRLVRCDGALVGAVARNESRRHREKPNEEKVLHRGFLGWIEPPLRRARSGRGPKRPHRNGQPTPLRSVCDSGLLKSSPASPIGRRVQGLLFPDSAAAYQFAPPPKTLQSPSGGLYSPIRPAGFRFELPSAQRISLS